MQAAELQAKPPLSIIVPVLNEARQLPALLDHLQHWQHRGCEILIVDGGSTDESPRIAASRGFTVIQAERGRARQMNAGAQQATGNILLFLHADTRLPPQADVLIQSALVIESNHWGRFDVSIDGDHWLLPVIAWLMNRRSRLTGIATGDQAIFVSASTFKAIGGYADIPLMEDIQLSKDLRLLSAPVCLAQQVSTSGRRWMANGVWRTIWLMWRLRWAYWRGVPAENLAAIYQCPLPMDTVQIVIFAKAPVAGFAKTRLIPQLGAEGAAALAKQLLEHAVSQAVNAHIGPVELCVTPDQQHPIWQTLKSVQFRGQGDGDLGERMARAAQRVIRQGTPVLLIGTDCPQLDSGHLQSAAQGLSSHDCCMVPALDGGYTLLGLRHYHPSLFTDIPWSTGEVAAITRARIQALGWSLAEFPPLPDIDEPADLVYLPDDWPGIDRGITTA